LRELSGQALQHRCERVVFIARIYYRSATGEDANSSRDDLGTLQEQTSLTNTSRVRSDDYSLQEVVENQVTSCLSTATSG
jgi:hypothetical protein